MGVRTAIPDDLTPLTYKLLSSWVQRLGRIDSSFNVITS